MFGPVSTDRSGEEQYAYDLAGNPTSQVSTRLGSASTGETQCYQYNSLDQLSAAWTATDACAATPTTAAHSTVGDGLGSASAYWTTWSYNNVLGTTTSQDQHSLTGGSNTVTADSYGGTSGGPNALTSAATTGGSTSTATFGYDSAGNMTSRSTPAGGAQTLTWAADGKLASVTGTGGATSYVDNAGGNLLLQENPGSTTVYLPGEQLTAVTSGGTTTVTGARIIALPSGGNMRARTGATTSYRFEVPDQHGTNGLELDNTAQVPTWRQFTPYGAPRGTAVTWSDNRSFLNKPADTATGLTYVGACAYDPVTGQFISPDPILKPSDPQNLNPYAYAEDNPVANSDPTGLSCDSSHDSANCWSHGGPCVMNPASCAPQATGSGSGGGSGATVTTPGTVSCDSVASRISDGCSVSAAPANGSGNGLSGLLHAIAHAYDESNYGIDWAYGESNYGTDWAWEHAYLQGSGCLVVCVSVTLQDGDFIFGGSAWSYARPVSGVTPMYAPELISRPDVPTLGSEPVAPAGLKGYKASTFLGLSAGINTATLSESLQNNVTMGGCYADAVGACVGFTGQITPGKGMGPVRPYVGAVLAGGGLQAQFGPSWSWDFSQAVNNLVYKYTGW